MILKLTDGQSTSVKAIAWCHQASSNYLKQRWLSSMTPYDVTRPQWVTWVTQSKAIHWQISSPFTTPGYNWNTPTGLRHFAIILVVHVHRHRAIENHYGDVKWPPWRLELLANRVVQLFVQITNSIGTSKIRFTGHLWGVPVTGGFPSQGASNAVNVSIWWRHNAITMLGTVVVSCDSCVLCDITST